MNYLKRIFRRFWPVNGYIAVLIGFMALMTLLTGIVEDRDKLSAVLFVLTVFAVVAAALLNEYLRRETEYFLTRISEELEPRQERALCAIPVPVAVIGYKGELIWYNNLFKKELLGGEDKLGIRITRLSSDFDLESVHVSRKFRCTWNDNRYGCTPIPLSGEDMGKHTIYFYDITELCIIEDKYLESRPTVMIIVFDNEDELFRARESERLRVISEVDGLINRWASGMSGICWVDARDKSLVVLEETNARKLINSKFEILEEAKKIVVEDGTPVTLSIGVGRGGIDVGECEEWALQALDMALGRGGDQAVVNENRNYSFFGGASNSSESQSKVRMRMHAMALSELIAKCDNCIIMGHRRSDLDSVGAAVGMAAIANCFDKEALIAVNRAETLADDLIEYYTNGSAKKPFVTPVEALDHMRDGTLLIVVDTNSIELVESAALLERAKDIIVIDHHRMVVNHISNSRLLIHETYASSACEIVSELAQNMNTLIVRWEADAMLAGIMLDTKNFAIRTGMRTFEAAAYLRNRGAEPVEVRHFFTDTVETYAAKSAIVTNAKIKKGYAISVADWDINNLKIVASQAADDMLTLSGVLASFVVFPLDGAISISARSLGKVNVQMIMEKLGGGGHLTMAGAVVGDKTIEEVLGLLENAIAEQQAAPKQ